jgi:mono/diheme cytochrome c family protein
MNMREILARIVCLLAALLVLTLAHVFAAKHNSRKMADVENATATAPPAPTAVAEILSPDIARGRQIYAELNCAGCHAIAGLGNPRHPLDGVGSLRNPTELRDWITGTGTAARELAASVVRRKQRYRELSAADLDALVAYLASLPAQS